MSPAMHGIDPARLRVEQALALLPDVGSLAILRAALVATSRGGIDAGRYATVGKRLVQLDDLHAYGQQTLASVAERARRFYEAGFEALASEIRKDRTGVALALLDSGDLEEQEGRPGQARLWYDSALRVAQSLPERGPEIEALGRIGLLATSRGLWNDAIRAHRRCLELASVEGDARVAVRACLGLGDAYLARSDWEASRQWYEQGLHDNGADEQVGALLRIGLCEAALGRDDPTEAEAHLSRAQAAFRHLADPSGLVRSRIVHARIEARRSRPREALARLREAIDLTRAGGLAAEAESEVRLEIARLHAAENRIAEGESEARRVEELAILNRRTPILVRVYLLMGQLRATEQDDTGFVFFEKALELCRGPERLARLEAETYRAYGMFRRALGDHDEAMVYLARSREITLELGNGALHAALAPEPETSPPHPPTQDSPA